MTPPRSDRPVVVAVDVDDPVSPALAWAVEVATRRGSPVRLVAAVPHRTSPDPFTAEFLASQHTADVVAARRALEEALRAQSWTGSPELVVREGGPVDVLVRESGAAALVVVGARRRNVHVAGDRGGWWEGSVGEHVVSLAACPVAVVRRAGCPDGPVVCAHDGSAAATAAARFAAAEAAAVGAPLLLLRVGGAAAAGRRVRPDSPAVPLTDVVRSVTAVHPRLTVHAETLEDGHPSDVLVTVGARARLLVLGAAGASAFDDSPLGSVCRTVLARSEGPLVVVPGLVGSEPAR